MSLTFPYTFVAVVLVVELLSKKTFTSVAFSLAIGRPLICTTTLCFQCGGYTSFKLFQTGARARSGRTPGCPLLIQAHSVKTGTFCGQRCGPVIGMSDSMHNIPVAHQSQCVRPVRRVGSRVAAARGERVALVKRGLTRRVVVVVVKRQRNAAPGVSAHAAHGNTRTGHG